jgi:heterotetrameric sarcosine oxidase gamma subunit
VSDLRGHLRCELRTWVVDRAIEFSAFRFPPPARFASRWPVGAGAVVRDASGRATILHIAPSRWLLPSPDGAAAALVADASGEGTAVAVDGKWHALELIGPDASRLLASSADVEAMLEGRACAATTLFDCPLIIVRAAAGFVLYVKASYSEALLGAIDRLRASNV